MTSQKVLRYIIFIVVGYVLAFGLIYLLFALLNVSGWYVVYIPFLAIFGSVVALFFVNLRKPKNDPSIPPPTQKTN